MKCILIPSGADIISYGMGEKTIVRIAEELEKGRQIDTIRELPQTVYLSRPEDIPGGITAEDIVLHSHEE